MKRSPYLSTIILAALIAFAGCDDPIESDVDEPDEELAVDEEESDSADDSDEEVDEQADEGAELDLPNMGTPTDGIVTAAQPTKEDYAELTDAGITKVISLRDSDEEGFIDAEPKAEEYGFDYVQIPVDEEEGLTAENAKKVDDALADVDGDALLHCGTSERAGAMLTMRGYIHLDMGGEEAVKLGKSGGMDAFEKRVRKHLEL